MQRLNYCAILFLAAIFLALPVGFTISSRQANSGLFYSHGQRQFFYVQLTLAEDGSGGGTPGSGGGAPGSGGGTPGSGGGAPSGRQVYKTLPNPLGSQTMTIGSVPQIVNKIINAILTIIGAIALLVVIYGGFMWMTSAGNENLVAKGKSTLMWAAIALAIIFLAWMLVGFLFQALGV